MREQPTLLREVPTTESISKMFGHFNMPGIEILPTATFHDHKDVVFGCVTANITEIEALVLVRRAVELAPGRGFISLVRQANCTVPGLAVLIC